MSSTPNSPNDKTKLARLLRHEVINHFDASGCLYLSLFSIQSIQVL